MKQKAEQFDIEFGVYKVRMIPLEYYACSLSELSPRVSDIFFIYDLMVSLSFFPDKLN